jgi:hypothetical protein
MLRQTALLAALTLAVASPLAGQGGVVTTYTRLTDSIVYLPYGDSLEFQATGPAVVPHEAPGLMVTFHPFFSLDDTVRVRKAALVFFQSLLPRLTGPPPFIVLRAVDVPAARRNQGGYYPLHAFGVVLETHDDGRWYELHQTTPAF